MPHIAVLYLSPAGIGEVILQTPLYRALRDAFPSSRITAVVARGNAAVLANNPAITRLHTFATPGGLLRLLLGLRDTLFDCCYVLDKSWKATYLARTLVRSREYIGFRRRAFEAFPLSRSTPYDASRHETDYYLELAGLQDADPTPQVFPPAEDLHAAEQALKEWPLPRERTVCLCPGGARNRMVGDEPFRRWPAERYAELAYRLSEKGYGIILLGADSDRPINRMVRERVGQDRPAMDLAGALPLLASGVVAGKAGLTITHDSGLMHLASCFCRNMLCLFGPTSPATLAPRSAGRIRCLWKDDDIYDRRVRIFGTRTLAKSLRTRYFVRLTTAAVLAEAEDMLKIQQNSSKSDQE